MVIWWMCLFVRAHIYCFNACADAGKQFAEARLRSSGFDVPVYEQNLFSVSGLGALDLSLSSTEPTGTLDGLNVDR